MRKLGMLNRIVRLDELKIPSNNRLEALKVSRRGQWGIRINDHDASQAKKSLAKVLSNIKPLEIA